MPKSNSNAIDYPLPVGIVAVAGASTAMGKSTFADVTASYFQAAKVAVHTMRIETGRRRAEFSERNSFVDLDEAGRAANAVGAEASLLDRHWPKIRSGIDSGQVVVIDCGAGAQELLMRVAGPTGLAELVAARGARFWTVVMTTPEPESARQAAALVGDVAHWMPGAEVLLALNHSSPAARPGLDTLQARAVTAILDPLQARRIAIPFCGAQALPAFAASGRTFHEILRATPDSSCAGAGGVSCRRCPHRRISPPGGGRSSTSLPWCGPLLPRTADRSHFMVNHALARALERLVPFYRGQMVRALARTLADDDTGAGLEYLRVLDAAEIKRAHRLAVAMRMRRDAVPSEHRPARGAASAKAFIRRLADLIRRRNK